MIFKREEFLILITFVFALYTNVSCGPIATTLFEKNISHIALDDFGNAYVAIESSVHVVTKDMNHLVFWNLPATLKNEPYVEPIKFLALKTFKNESFLIVCAKTKSMTCYRVNVQDSKSKTVPHEQLPPPLQSIYRLKHTENEHYEFFLDKAEPYPCRPVTAFTEENARIKGKDAANLFEKSVSEFVESRYVYHFEHGHYAYFLKVFATKIENESYDRMVLTRISNRREYIDSFTEIPLSPFTEILLSRFTPDLDYCYFVKFVSADFGRMNPVQKEMVETKTTQAVKGDYALFLSVLCLSKKEPFFRTELFFISMDEVNLIVEGEYRKFRSQTSSTLENFDLFAISKNVSAFKCVNTSNTLRRPFIASANVYSIDAMTVFGTGSPLVRFKTLSRDQQSMVIIYADNREVSILRVSDGIHKRSDWFHVLGRKKVNLIDYGMKMSITQNPLDFTPGKMDKNENYAFIASGQELLKIYVGSPCPMIREPHRCLDVNKGLFAQCMWCMSKCLKQENCDMSVFDDLKYPRIVDAWPLEFAVGGRTDFDIAIEHDQISLQCPSKAIIVGQIMVKCKKWLMPSQSFTRQNKTIKLAHCQCESIGHQLSQIEPVKFTIQGIETSNLTLEFNETFSVVKIFADYAAVKTIEVKDQTRGLLAICAEHIHAIHNGRREFYSDLELVVYNDSCICVNFRCENELQRFQEPEVYIWSNSPIASNAHSDSTGNFLVLGNGSVQNIRDIVLNKTRENLTNSDDFDDTICETVNWPLIISPGNSKPNVELKTNVPPKKEFLILIAVGSIMLLILSLLIIVGVRRVKFSQSSDTKQDVQLLETNYDEQSNEWTLKKLQDLTLNSGARLIGQSDISDIETKAAGQGNFGIVLKGILKCDSNLKVAIKTLKHSTTPDEVMLFIKEALKMLKFEHENVIGMIGLSLHNGTPAIVMPFYENGDLLTFVQKNSNSRDMTIRLRFAKEIASGMEHLTSRGVVHRDLAARNCMLDDQLVVKVADFGLSRSLYGKTAYKRKTDSEMARAWMAPETSSKCAIFNETTDVWSYGVTLWEIFTGGLDATRERERIWPDVRLPLKDVPSEMHDIILACWHIDALERPTFSKLLDMLKDVSFAASKTGYDQNC